MKLVVLHNAVPVDAPPDERDNLVQASVVGAALAALGHQVEALPFSLDLAHAAARLRAAAPDVVFNLVESVDGKGSLVHLAPALLDALPLPYTGAPTAATVMTSNKLLGKRTMRGARVRTPHFYTVADLPRGGPVPAGPYIVKSVWEHASIGLDENAVLDAERHEALRAACLERRRRLGGEWFAEAFIAGREFNVALLAGADGPQVLPPAEILFVGYTDERRKLVDYRAKWVEASFEFSNTPRRFEYPAADAPLLRELTRIARRCWRVFELRGYARVDFRVDAQGLPFVLEINTNPCLSPDAGYAAALTQAGISFETAIARILADARTTVERKAFSERR